MSMLEESAKGMARGAATWDAQTLSLLEESAKGTPQNNTITLFPNDKPRGASPRRDYVRSEEDGIVQIE